MVRREYGSALHIVFVDNLPLQITTAKLGSFCSEIWLFFNVSFTPIFPASIVLVVLCWCFVRA